MGRSGYVEDGDDDYPLALWRGAVERAIHGQRGQAFLREMAAALDAMPVKELHADVLVEGEKMCAIGTVAAARGIDVSKVDPFDRDEVGKVFGIAPSLASEIAYENDDDFARRKNETPAERWTRMRAWVDAQIDD